MLVSEALILTVPRLPGPVQPRDLERLIERMSSLVGQMALVLHPMHTLVVLPLKQQRLGHIVTMRTPIMGKQNRR